MVRRVGSMVAHFACPPLDAQSAPVAPRELLERARPLFVSAASLAAERMTAADGLALRSALARMLDPSPHVRAEAYRAFLKRVGTASGSSFHRASIAAVIAEFGDIIDLGLAHDADRPAASGKGDLERLCEALETGNGRIAAQAAEDHLLVVGQIIDQVVSPVG